MESLSPGILKPISNLQLVLYLPCIISLLTAPAFKTKKKKKKAPSQSSQKTWQMTHLSIGFNNKQPPQQREAFPHLPTKAESDKKLSETCSQRSTPINVLQLL